MDNLNMNKTLENFKKENNYLLCVDSDGCAMDTMTIKHERCFGPCFVEEFGLQKINEQALSRWNEINLYEITRGKNRFITLELILSEYNGKYLNLEELNLFRAWVNSGAELSNRSLEKKILTDDATIFKKALAWSKATNKEIAKLTFEDKVPFYGVEDFLKLAHGKVDLAVISSADDKSLKEEWKYFELDQYMDVLASQEAGTKEKCLKLMIEKGYEKNNILMAGDSPGDLEAAEKAGVFFYPILPKKEIESWNTLKTKYLDEFILGNYEYHVDQLKAIFNKQFEEGK